MASPSNSIFISTGSPGKETAPAQGRSAFQWPILDLRVAQFDQFLNLGPQGITQLLLCRLIFVFEGQFVEIGLVAVLLVCRPRYRDGNAVVFNLSRLICCSKCESACDLTPNRLPTVTLVGHTINSSIQCVAMRGLGSDLDADRAPDPTPNNTGVRVARTAPDGRRFEMRYAEAESVGIFWSAVSAKGL